MTVAELMLELLEIDPNKDVQVGICVDDKGGSYYSTDVEIWQRSPVPLAGKEHMFLIFGKKSEREHDRGGADVGLVAEGSKRRSIRARGQSRKSANLRRR